MLLTSFQRPLIGRRRDSESRNARSTRAAGSSRTRWESGSSGRLQSDRGGFDSRTGLSKRLVAETVQRRGEIAQTEVRLLPSRLPSRAFANLGKAAGLRNRWALARYGFDSHRSHSTLTWDVGLLGVVTSLARRTTGGFDAHTFHRPRNSANRVPGFEPGGRRFESCRGRHRDVGKPGLTRLPWEQESARSNRAIPTSRERPGYRLPGPGCNPVAFGRCWFDSSLSHLSPSASGARRPAGPIRPRRAGSTPALAIRPHTVAVV